MADQDKKQTQKLEDDKKLDISDVKMKVRVYSPFKVYYDNDASSISAENDTGPFDILPHHKNFMTLVHPCELIIRSKGEEDFKIRITRAIMHIKSDQVTVFLDV